MKSKVTCKISKIHNFLGFRNKSQSISDYPVKEFWKSDDFWASSTLLKKYSWKWDTVYLNNTITCAILADFQMVTRNRPLVKKFRKKLKPVKRLIYLVKTASKENRRLTVYFPMSFKRDLLWTKVQTWPNFGTFSML